MVNKKILGNVIIQGPLDEALLNLHEVRKKVIKENPKYSVKDLELRSHLRDEFSFDVVACWSDRNETRLERLKEDINKVRERLEMLCLEKDKLLMECKNSHDLLEEMENELIKHAKNSIRGELTC